MSDGFPREERYGLTNQIRRAAVSVPSNIAEGAARKNRKEYLQFLHIALGSLTEIHTQLILSQRLNYINKICWESADNKLSEVKQLLLATINPVQNPSNTTNPRLTTDY
ncbi:MAG: four helix bundle protein [Bacteroidota bacterium]